MRIRVSPAGSPAFLADLAEFLIDNGIEGDDAQRLVSQLNNGLEPIIGGGAAPFVTLEKV